MAQATAPRKVMATARRSTGPLVAGNRYSTNTAPGDTHTYSMAVAIHGLATHTLACQGSKNCSCGAVAAPKAAKQAVRKRRNSKAHSVAAAQCAPTLGSLSAHHANLVRQLRNMGPAQAKAFLATLPPATVAAVCRAAGAA